MTPDDDAQVPSPDVVPYETVKDELAAMRTIAAKAERLSVAGRAWLLAWLTGDG